VVEVIVGIIISEERERERERERDGEGNGFVAEGVPRSSSIGR
jgi:hypothetical protein